MTERVALPDLDTLDLIALKALILSQHQEILSQEEQLASRDSEIEQLKLLIAKLRRMQFGRKSEKLERQIEQLELSGIYGVSSHTTPSLPLPPYSVVP